MNKTTRQGNAKQYIRRHEFSANKNDMLWAINNVKPFDNYQWFLDRLRDTVIKCEELVFTSDETLNGKQITKMPEEWESFLNYAL